MDRTQVPVLRTPLEVADYLTTHDWGERCAASEKAELILGAREAKRLWRLGGQIVRIRASRPGCAVGWCPTCHRRYTLIDRDMTVPAHIHPDLYDTPCAGSGRPGVNPTVEARS